jgi:hydroxyacylglutathione hydrolase
VFFRQLLHEDRSCVSYVVGCTTQGVAIVVDPQGEPSQYLSLTEEHGLRITDVADTHVHADHSSTARALAESVEGKLRLGSEADVRFDFEPLHDGDVLEVGNRHIEVIHTPGHTPEHVCFLVDDWFVLTGDTLFVGDVGRVDLALVEIKDDELRGRARTLHSSLRRLLELRDDIEVHPGHYSGSVCGRGMDGKTISTIGRERRRNAALKLDIEAFVDYQLTNSPGLPQDFHQIKRANLGSAAKERPMR